jgi:hypothetical protein
LGRTPQYRWRIVCISGSPLEHTPVEQVGYVEAPDEEAAIYDDPEKRKWLVAQRVS